jgi:hypothetical protein
MTNSFEIIFKQKIKYANILFSVSLFYLLGIFVFNSNIASINETEENLENNFAYKIESIKRIELYENEKKQFIKKFIFSKIQTNNFVKSNDKYLLGISYLNYYDKDYFFYPEHNLDFEIPQVNKDSINTIIKNCQLFSERLNSILKKDNLDDKTASSLAKKSLDSIFSNKKISKLLDKDCNLRLVKLMKNPDDPDVKYIFLNYILTGSSWGYPQGGTHSPRTNSYTENYKSDISLITEGQFYYAFLGNQNMDKVKEFLLNDLSASYDELIKYKSTEKKLSTNIIGVNIDFNYIFLFSGLVLFFFLTLFYIYHKIESKKIDEDELNAEYLFPNFGIRTSPFQSLFPPKKNVLNFNYYFTNSVWFIFLLLPIIILFIGYVFRYNLQIDLSSSDYNVLLYEKQSDVISFFGDLINLVALFFSVWIFIDLTLLNDKKNRPIEKIKLNIWLFILSIVVFIILSYFNILPNYSYYSEYSGIGFLAILSNYLFLVQILVWFILCYYSMINTSFFGIILSIIAIYINLILLF